MRLVFLTVHNIPDRGLEFLHISFHSPIQCDYFIIQIKLPDHFSIEHFRSLALSTSFNTEIDYKFMIIYLFTSNVANKCMHE